MTDIIRVLKDISELIEHQIVQAKKAYEKESKEVEQVYQEGRMYAYKEVLSFIGVYAKERTK